MAAKKGIYDIPFDKDGNQQDYPQSWYVPTGETKKYPHSAFPEVEHPVTVATGPTWITNFEFEDTLELVSYGRGRSSVTFTLKRTDGTTVSMFVSDFYEAAFKMKDGKITGRFTFIKKGQNYGCKMIGGE